MATWHDLPTEIRIIILKEIESNNGGGTTNHFAAVSKEWQMYFEPVKFRRLILSQSCIPDFDQIVRHNRRGMVEYIWLRVELARYNCPACEYAEKRIEVRENNQIFTAALYQLLKVLSTWKKGGRYGVGRGGLVLELSAHSPSDCEHYFIYPLGKDVYPHTYDENCTNKEYRDYESRSELNTIHEVTYTGQNLSTTRALRFHGSLIKLDYAKVDIPKTNETLPTVSVVRRLLKRRQCPRSFHPNTLLKIFESLRGLEEMMLEHMIQDYPIADKNVQRSFDVFLRNIRSLKSFSIFGDHNILSPIRHKPYNMLPSLGWTLADESHSLEHLSAPFLVDAKDFFRDFWPGHEPKSLDVSRSGVQRALMSRLSSSQRRALGSPRKSTDFERRLSKEFRRMSNTKRISCSLYKPRWSNLESLALTSSLFNVNTQSETINNLLQAAAGAVMEMPKLQTMEIFNEDRCHVFAFRYDRNVGGIPTITVSSTWDHTLGPEVLDRWDRVGHNHTGHATAVARKNLNRFFYKSHGAVVSILKLQSLILHPVSLCQFVCEFGMDLDNEFDGLTMGFFPQL